LWIGQTFATLREFGKTDFSMHLFTRLASGLAMDGRANFNSKGDISSTPVVFLTLILFTCYFTNFRNVTMMKTGGLMLNKETMSQK
jgi:hypothetical protein